jgi:hypothetical protein
MNLGFSRRNLQMAALTTWRRNFEPAYSMVSVETFKWQNVGLQKRPFEL